MKLHLIYNKGTLPVYKRNYYISLPFTRLILLKNYIIVVRYSILRQFRAELFFTYINNVVICQSKNTSLLILLIKLLLIFI